MTSICLDFIPKTCQLLFAPMDDLATAWPSLAPTPCRLAMLDLHLLPPLIENAGTLDFLLGLLSPAEIEMFRRFTSAKRKVEWLGGRLSAKHCLHQVLNEPRPDRHSFSKYSILPDANGRPQLEDSLPIPSYPAAPCVSISHSRGYAVALACQNGCCGIDIQQIRPQLTSVQQRFTTDQELALIDPSIAPLTRLALLWTAKEAVKKCFLADHPSFFEMISVKDVRYQPDQALWTISCRLADSAALSVRVQSAQLNDYLVACVWGEHHA